MAQMSMRATGTGARRCYFFLVLPGSSTEVLTVVGGSAGWPFILDCSSERMTASVRALSARVANAALLGWPRTASAGPRM